MAYSAAAAPPVGVKSDQGTSFGELSYADRPVRGQIADTESRPRQETSGLHLRKAPPSSDSIVVRSRPFTDPTSFISIHSHKQDWVLYFTNESES